MWQSWAMGGYALLVHKDVNKVLGEMPDSLAKARPVLELGIQTMISSWFWKWYSQRNYSEEVKTQVVWAALTNIQTLLGIETKDNVALYMGFDKEFQSIMNTEGKTLPICYVDMFYQRYLECITGEQIVNWRELRFPLESHKHFINSCDMSRRGGLHEPEDYLAIWFTVLHDASNVMFSEFNRLFESK